MILKIFSTKKIAKKLAFLTQNIAKLCKILIITLVFEKNAIFFAENLQKSSKIVIITSTPDFQLTRKMEPFIYYSFVKHAKAEEKNIADEISENVGQRKGQKSRFIIN
jgi:hypothetical protein